MKGEVDRQLPPQYSMLGATTIISRSHSSGHVMILDLNSRPRNCFAHHSVLTANKSAIRNLANHGEKMVLELSGIFCVQSHVR